MINSQLLMHNHSPIDLFARALFTRREKCKHKIELVTTASTNRKQLESFISESYLQNFDAKLNTFFPIIMAIFDSSNNELISAIGLRYADSGPLFSECYLSESIESIINDQEQCHASRKKIIELGNFVVRKKSDIKLVLPTIAKFVRSINVDYLVYTLTKPIQNYFNSFNLELCYLQTARQSCVNDAAADWGKYYAFSPEVFYSSVSKNKNNI